MRSKVKTETLLVLYFIADILGWLQCFSINFIKWYKIVSNNKMGSLRDIWVKVFKNGPS